MRATIAGMQAAAEARNAAGVVAPLAEDFIGPDGMDRATFHRYATATLLRSQQVGVTLGPLQVEVIGERANVRFTAATTGGSGGWLPDQARVYDVETGWRLEDGDWKLVSLRWEPGL